MLIPTQNTPKGFLGNVLCVTDPQHLILPTKCANSLIYEYMYFKDHCAPSKKKYILYVVQSFYALKQPNLEQIAKNVKLDFYEPLANIDLPKKSRDLHSPWNILFLALVSSLFFISNVIIECLCLRGKVKIKGCCLAGCKYCSYLCVLSILYR